MARQHGADAVENGSPEASTQTWRPRCASTSATPARTGSARRAPRRGSAQPRGRDAACRRTRSRRRRPARARPGSGRRRRPRRCRRSTASAAVRPSRRAQSRRDMRAFSFSAAPRRRGGSPTPRRRPDLEVTLSLAGRTATSGRAAGAGARSAASAAPQGLADYLAAERIDALIDATHPYAATMSPMRRGPPQRAGVPLLALRRPPGSRSRAIAGPRPPMRRAAVRALGDAPRRVFLALGRNEIAPFAAAPQHHYLVRSVDPVEPPLACRTRATSIGARAVHASRRSRAARRARHRDRGGQEQRRRAPPTARSRRRARLGLRSSCCAGRRCPRCRRRDDRGRGGLARSCARALRRSRRVDQRRTPGARDHMRLARAHDDECRHVGGAGSASRAS